MLVICKELRRAYKDGLAKSYDFVGPRRSWKKVPDADWDNFRHVWLPNCSYVINIPSKNETVYMRNLDGLLFAYNCS